MPDLAMLDYFYGDEAEQFTFTGYPKCCSLTPATGAYLPTPKSCTGLCLTVWGCQFGWLAGRIQPGIIFFTLEDALEYLCCGHTKAVSLFGELDKAGLIERKKQGQGKPTKIYVKNFVRNAEVLTSEKRKSKVPQSGSQELPKNGL